MYKKLTWMIALSAILIADAVMIEARNIDEQYQEQNQQNDAQNQNDNQN